MGKASGTCPRCSNNIEDLDHLFYYCPFNMKYIDSLHSYFKGIHPNPFSPQEILLGTYLGLDPPFWLWVRSVMLFQIWKERNAYLFDEGGRDHYFTFLAHIHSVAFQVEKCIVDAAEDYHLEIQKIKQMRWQSWKLKMLRLYSNTKS